MKKTQFKFSLSISILKESNRFIAYSPAIDLSTSGKTYEEAKKRFDEAASVFFEEIFEQGTLNDVLKDLGWKKIQKKWIPPLVISQESQEISVYA